MTSTELPARFSRWLGAMATVVFAALLATGTELPDPDIWWNLVDGEAFLDHGRAPPLATWGDHGCLDAREHDHRLGSSAWALAWRDGGMWGLVALRAALVALAGLAVVWALRRGPLLVAVSWGCGLVGALAFRASARPELVGLVLLAWCTALAVDVVGRELPRRGLVGRLLALAVLQLCAVFTHATFILAVVAVGALLGVTLVADVVNARGIGLPARRAAAAFAAVALPLVARPSAVALVAVAGEERAIATALGFAEYRPLAETVRSGFVPPSLACIALLVVAPVIVLVTRPPPPAPSRTQALTALAAIAPFVVVALTMVRGLAPLAVVAAVAGGGVVSASVARRGLLAGLLAVVTLAVVGARAIDDPALDGRRPPDLAPTRLTPLPAARFLVDSGFRGLVYAPLHLGNWLLHEGAPAVRVVWSGRRTYSLACGQELLAGRRGGADFVKVDDRLKPDAVLVTHATEPGLVAALVERGWALAHLDLRTAVYVRHATGALPAPTAETLVEGENRDLDPALLAGLLRSACSVLGVSTPDGPGRADVCGAAAALERHAAAPR